jgi:hypothetical protein
VIDRRWTNPGEPLLRNASQWLVDQAAVARTGGVAPDGAGRLCDLSNWLCVMRGRRAGRLLLRELLDAAQRSDRGLVPPRIVTQGGMVELLLEAGVPAAHPIERTLAWMQALQSAPSEILRPLMPELPAGDDWQAWHRLARTINALHEELAGAGVEMLTAASKADAMDQPVEGDRWRVLADVIERYRAVLRRCGLVDPHEARWAAANSGRAPGVGGVSGIALIGVVELNAMQRAAIESAGVPVTAFVHADQSMQAGFDAFGCVEATFWQEREIPLSDGKVAIADRPGDQAQAIMHALADLGGTRAAEDIVIGVGDDTLRDEIERAALWADVHVHDSQGISLKQTPAARLLAAIADYLDDARFAHFASLLRHADLAAWLNRVLPKAQGDITGWLSLLDCYFADHLQQRCAGEYLGEPGRATKLRHVHEKVHELLRPCVGEGRPIAQWLAPIAQVLWTVYDDGDARDEAGVERLIDSFSELAALPGALQPTLPAPAAIRLLLREVGEKAMPAQSRRDAIEMLGWLDLHPDPSPVLIVAGVNDGFVPATTSADPFLPDSMRAALGLACNRTRYARDAYLLEVLVRGGQQLTLITGRRSTNGEPLTPSRLLLACDERELPGRVQRLCSDPPTPGLPVGAPRPGAESRFVVPMLPLSIEPPAYLRVTDFRVYLECPYRFALGRLLGLEGISDRLSELDAGTFGSLAHDVLAQLGRSEEMLDETDPQCICEFLLDHLKQRIRGLFGDAPLTAVRVQAAQLEQRMLSFAAFQAATRREGWRIAFTEHAMDERSVLDVPGEGAMPIHGKIDRIDRHEHTGAWRIIDYKTSDSGKGPIEAHHSGRAKIPVGDDLAWSDLQLPLYRYLAARSALGVDGAVELGFIVLPRQSNGAKWIASPWEAAHLESAVACACDVVRAIRAGRFERNLNFTSPFDAFARICQSMVLESAEELEDMEAALP